MVEIAAGASWDARRATIASELALGYLAHDLHGRNGGGANDTADGSEFGAVTAGVAVWPGLRVGPVTAYAGGGGGVAFVHGLGASDVAPFWQAGAGVRWRWLDLGYRHTRIGAQLDGYRLRYDAHALALGVRW